ncbi:MAG: helix-hairpin-helix domain-containing protein [Ginsengibacter sp.]
MSKIDNHITFSKIFCFAFSCIITCCAFAQEIPVEPTEPPPLIQEQLENLTANNDDATTEDDSYLQALVHFIKDPLNLNYADEGLLQQLQILSPLQISNLITYRKLFGPFISIYELQAVPGWDVITLRKIKPYITVAQKVNVFFSLGQRLHGGDNTLLVRGTQVLEKSKGYLLDSSQAKNFYPGSQQKLLIRYKYKFKNQLQYGFTAEKDAGEQFFKGSQKLGFDFYSAHFFIRNLGVIKALALGDFTVNLGQGLTQWGSLAFGKGADILNIKRQSDVLRPYNSAGEILFNRGAGITLQKKKWETTLFASYRKLDAGFNVDTLDLIDYVSSLQQSGYHRTSSEVASKGVQGQITLGGNLKYTSDRWHVGINGVHYQFDHRINKQDVLYNLFAISGKKAGNYSVDYSYTFKNAHFFGEAATDENGDPAFINGLAISPDSRVDMSFLYRKISKGYQSLYSNAFTENTFPTNESGFYSGITITPTATLRIDGYADFYHFPWIKYRTDAPSSGSDYMLQVTYNPNRDVQVYARYRDETKPINYNPFNLPFNQVIDKPKQGFRTQFSYKINKTYTFRSRAELSWFDKRGDAPENGFLIYTDFIYKPLLKPLSGNIRLCYFETDGYNSRLYAFENDVLYSYSIPVFFGKGYRYYINVNYDLTRKLSFWMRIAQSYYPDQNSIGSGLDVIKGNTKTEIKLQAAYSF